MKLQNKLNFLSISKERKSKIHSDPRKDRSKEYALEFLYYKGVNNLPIDLLNMQDLFAGYNWIVLSYEEAKDALNAKDPLNIKARDADARTLRLRNDNTFLTVYIKNKRYPNRDYYTLAHELGHIVLGHFFDFNFTALSRGGLTKKEYEILEREAEIFAAELIMPAPVLKELKSKSYKNIMYICKVTRKAAEIRTNEILSYKISNTLRDIYSTIKNNFYNFIYKKSCSNCGNYLVSPDSTYCPICGNNLKWGDGIMNYNDGYQVDADGKVWECPRCGNHEINEDASYCKICGTYLINRCSNTNGYDTVDGWFDACGRPAEGNARYCIYCGQITTFYNNGLLQNWETTKEEFEQEQEVEESMEQIAAMRDRSIEDDGLPF